MTAEIGADQVRRVIPDYEIKCGTMWTWGREDLERVSWFIRPPEIFRVVGDLSGLVEPSSDQEANHALASQLQALIDKCNKRKGRRMVTTTIKSDPSEPWGIMADPVRKTARVVFKEPQGVNVLLGKLVRNVLDGDIDGGGFVDKFPPKTKVRVREAMARLVFGLSRDGSHTGFARGTY